MDKKVKKEDWHNHYGEKTGDIEKKESIKIDGVPRNVFFSGFFSWKIHDKELEFQVKNYNNLKSSQSYRWATVNIYLVLLAITLGAGIIGVYPIAECIAGIFLYLPVLFFISKGHRWATIALIIFWTYEKGYTIYANYESLGHITYGGLIWWWAVTPFFYKNLRVENMRKKVLEKRAKTEEVVIKESDNKSSMGNFCINCGDSVKEDYKFCRRCGEEVNSK